MATVIQGLVGFLSVPFLLGILGSDVFAGWVLMEPIVAVLAGLALAGSHYGYMHVVSSGALTSREAINQCVRFGWLPGAIVVVLGGGVATLILDVSFQSGIPQLFMVYITLEAVILFAQFQARATEDSVRFAATIWMRSIGIAVGLIFFKKTSSNLSLAEYLLFMIAVDAAVIGLVLFIYGRRHSISGMSGQREAATAYLSAVRYGFPIALAAGLAAAVSSGDRYVVQALLPSEGLPAYVVMVKIAGAMTFAIAPINLWWPVARHRHVQDHDGGNHFFSNVVPALLAYYLLAAGAIWIAAEELLPWYAPEIGGGDRWILLVLLLAGVAMAMSSVVNIGGLAPGKTHLITASVGLSAAIGLALALLIVPRFGYLGGAISAAVAQVANLVFVFLTSQAIAHVPHKYGRFFLLLVGGAISLSLISLSSSFASRIAILLVWLCFTLWYLNFKANGLDKSRCQK